MVALVDRAEDTRRARLRDSAADDLLRGFGLDRAMPVLGGLARRLVRPFVDDVAAMDAALASGGYGAAAEGLLAHYAGPVSFRGLEHVPPDGPLVVAANHPGTVDVPALWRLLAARADLRIIALDRPILRSLPHLSERLISVSRASGGRSGVVRKVTDHLRAGRAILTFPAGTIEPDPALRLTDALDSVAGWSPSVELFVQRVPEAVVLPVALSGVISARMLATPVARWRRTAEDRELTAATLQVLVRDRSIAPVVSAGEPLRAAELGELRDVMARLVRDSARG